MILIDSNIPMYLVGAAHPNKEAARQLVDRSITDSERLVTDAEVFQEILHRYTAIDRRDAIRPAFDLMLSLVDEVFGIELREVDLASRLALTGPKLSARDAIHLAVMQLNNVGTVMSFDRAFDGLAGITRLGR